MKNITEIRHAIIRLDQGLEPVFAVQHFHLRLVFQLLIASFFQNTVSSPQKTALISEKRSLI